MADDVENGIDDGPSAVLGRSPSRFMGRDQGFENGPDLIGQSSREDACVRHPCRFHASEDNLDRTTDTRLLSQQALSEEGAYCACHRSEAGGERRADKNGEDYYFHRLKPSANGEEWPEPQYSLADCPKDREGNLIAADTDLRNKVYRRLLLCLPLYQQHIEELERRGIKDGHKAAGYRSLGRERAKAVQQLIKAGMERDLTCVPGFYVAVSKKTGRRFWSVAGMGGLLFPILDAQGRIDALTVRLDDPPEDGSKYRFVSSKEHGGLGTAAPIHVSRFDGDKTLVRITEGVPKADVATRLTNILTIGLPGVNAWKRAARVLKEIGAKTVRVAFDADARRNRKVAGCLSHLIGHLRGKGFAVELELWDEADGKGIEDLLAAGKSPEVLTDASAIDAAVAEIMVEAEKSGPTPSGPPAGKACEAFDDPHLLARDYRKQFRFATSLETLYYHRQDWSRWDGRAYRVLDEKEIKAELIESIKAAFDRENLKHLARWKANGAEGSPPTTPKVTTKCVGNALLALAGMSLLRGLIEPHAWIGDCEREWAAGEMLAYNNALLHLPSFAEGKEQYSIKPTPLFFSANALDYHFAPDALEPFNWYAFLEQLWQHDRQAIETLQEWFGYCLLPDTSQQKILMIVGPRRSGKGTIARILRALIGIHNTASPTLASLKINFGLQPLLNKTLAIISDARLSGRTDAAVVTERLLSISGEDGQGVHRKHKSAVNLKLPVRFVILTNELARLNDPSGALVGRLVLLRQTQSFYGQEDTRLTEKLLTELPGILLSRHGRRRHLLRCLSMVGRMGQENLTKCCIPLTVTLCIAG